VTFVQPPTVAPEFIVTREYRRFAEFCDACRQARYIGVCYGVPGVGKTMSARHYAHWAELEGILGPAPHRHDGLPPAGSGPWRTILYTPGVVNTPRSIERDAAGLWRAVARLAQRAADVDSRGGTRRVPEVLDLVVVDEADRLKMASLEQLRDLYDRRQIGLVLIGMPGLQKRLARYAQLYSRVGFVHQFQPLSGREFQQVIERQWVQLRLDSTTNQGIDAGVLNAIARVTGGNFRLMQRAAGADRAGADDQPVVRHDDRGGRRRTRESGRRWTLSQHHTCACTNRGVVRPIN
jgi:DNA transposition AAA+ family ATPase